MPSNHGRGFSEGSEARRKRAKREDLELTKLEEEIKEKRIENLFVCMNMMSKIQPDWVETDTVFRMQAEQAVKNLLNDSKSDQTATDPTKKNQEVGRDPLAPLSITQVSRALGYALESDEFLRAEELAAKRYRAMHKTKPPLPTRAEIVDGVEHEVNVYTEADRELLKTVLIDLGIAGKIYSSDSSDSDE
jgi:hypothetical protein